MSFRDSNNGAILVFAGLGFGVLVGTIIGLILGSRRKKPVLAVDPETVVYLRNRAEQVLSELSASIASLEQAEPAIIRNY